MPSRKKATTVPRKRPHAVTVSDRIIRDSKLPLYHQLYEILRGKILRSEWQPGDLIPAESELIKQHGVSRITAREALDALVNDGLIYRQRGRGSFVSHPTVEQQLTRITTFTEDMRRRGFTPGTKVVSAKLIPASAETAAKLQVERGEEIVCLKRLRLADGEPMSVEEACLVHRYCPRLLDLQYRNRSLAEILDTQFGLRWLRAKQTIQAIAAPRDLASLLSIPPRSPVLYVERISFSEQDVPVEFLRVHHRGDRYALYGELRR